MNNDKIIFWLITPPNNMSAFIKAVTHICEGPVSVIACHNIRGERADSGFQDQFPWLSEYYILDNVSDGDRFIRDYLVQNCNEVHVFCGLRREPANYMYQLKSIKPDAKIIAITEKPAPNSGKSIVRIAKRCFFPLYYRFLYAKVQKTVNALFVFSLHGMDYIKKHGWRKSNLYNFMYCDQMPEEVELKSTEVSKKARFLYVGRFDYRMRGLDVIMKAFDGLEGDWSLSLVGGYGEKKDEVINWANTQPKVEFLGRWPSDQVANRMHDYDIYICASREDSWNGQTNLALSAGLGVLTTTEAGSDELVAYSGAGQVLPPGDDFKLRAAITGILNNREKIEKWHLRAAQYAPRITTKSVASYFINVVEREIYGKQVDTSCPWITEKENENE